MRKVRTSGSRGVADRGGRIRGWLLRRPILLLSCSLAVIAIAAGVWWGGYIGAAGRAAGNGMEHLLADMGFAVRKISLSGQEQTAADFRLSRIGHSARRSDVRC